MFKKNRLRRESLLLMHTMDNNKLCVTSKIGLFYMRVGFLLLVGFCVGLQIGILHIFIIEVVSTTNPGGILFTIVVSALLALIFTLVAGLEYFFISNIVLSSSLYIDSKGIYTDHRFIPWGAVVKIKCWHGNVPTVNIRYMQNGKKKKLIGALPIFKSRHYADIVQSLYENQGRNWSQIVGYLD